MPNHKQTQNVAVPTAFDPVTEYLKEYDGLVPVDHITHRVLPSEGLRKTGTSRQAMGGTMLSPITHRETGFDSNLERRCVFQSLQRSDVVLIQEQHVKTLYIDRHGQNRHTIWDLLLTLEDGTRELVSVKRLDIAESPNFLADFKLMAAAVPPGVADKACLATEYNLVPALCDRGELYHRALREAYPDNADVALSFITVQRKPVKIEVVCAYLTQQEEPDPARHFENLSKNFWAVVWLLANRKVRPVDDDYLTVKSEVVAR